MTKKNNSPPSKAALSPLSSRLSLAFGFLIMRGGSYVGLNKSKTNGFNTPNLMRAFDNALPTSQLKPLQYIWLRGGGDENEQKCN